MRSAPPAPTPQLPLTCPGLCRGPTDLIHSRHPVCNKHLLDAHFIQAQMYVLGNTDRGPSPQGAFILMEKKT